MIYTNIFDIAYIDMDGVASDWCGGVAKLMGVDADDFKDYHIYKVGGKTEEEMRELINNDVDFWANLEPMDKYDEMLEHLNGYCRKIVFLSKASPDIYYHSAPGKYAWLKKHVPKNIDYSVILTEDKNSAIDKSKKFVFIDDAPRNIESVVKDPDYDRERHHMILAPSRIYQNGEDYDPKRYRFIADIKRSGGDDIMVHMNRFVPTPVAVEHGEYVTNTAGDFMDVEGNVIPR